MRTDTAMLESHDYQSEPPLDCLILALGGDSDKTTPTEGPSAWSVQTSRQLTTRIFTGGHFFCNNTAGIWHGSWARQRWRWSLDFRCDVYLPC